MPSPSEIPETLKPYTIHGLDLQWRPGDRQAFADCPWCGREGKFSVVIQTGLWRCPACLEGNDKGGGNARVFIRLLWEKSYDTTKDYSELVKSRLLLSDEGLIHWGACKSILTGEWLIPGSGFDGKLNQLYIYRRLEDRMILWLTPGLGHQLYGVELYDRTKQHLYLCEGYWDGVAFWEVLRHSKLNDDEHLVHTSNPQTSLYGDANVLATPAASVFFDSWLPLFKGKTVHLLFDSDHPKEQENNRTTGPAGYLAMKRIAGILSKAGANAPSSINFLEWGPHGYDHTLPSGTDVRDFLCKA